MTSLIGADAERSRSSPRIGIIATAGCNGPTTAAMHGSYQRSPMRRSRSAINRGERATVQSQRP